MANAQVNAKELESEKKVVIASRENVVYTKCYCEENVWKLCEKIKEEQRPELDGCYVVFISNNIKAIPIWMQMASKTADSPVVWDYHVILLQKGADGDDTYIYDLDTRLPLPCPFLQYATEAIRSDLYMKPEFHRMFRIIPAEMFLNTFASDRSHMLKEDGSWMAPPPTYDCIQSQESTNNIQDFISMDPNVGFGEVVNSKEFLSRFSSPQEAMQVVLGTAAPVTANQGTKRAETKNT